MPNGGSDCCGTCCFNSKNIVGSSDPDAMRTRVVTCTIRDLKIPNPFWTYCANHPRHNPNKIDLPLGPVYVNDGYPYSRKVWIYPPDNEKIRLKLLDLLDNITNEVENKYPSETDLQEEVIKQLTSLKEERAIAGLKRIVNLDLEEYRHQQSPMIRNIAVTVGQAIEALLEITNGALLDDVKGFLRYGLEVVSDKGYCPEQDDFAAIRYHLVRGLEYVNSEEAEKLLMVALNDPHNDVKAFANEILVRK